MYFLDIDLIWTFIWLDNALRNNRAIIVKRIKRFLTQNAETVTVHINYESGMLIEAGMKIRWASQYHLQSLFT